MHTVLKLQCTSRLAPSCCRSQASDNSSRDTEDSGVCASGTERNTDLQRMHAVDNADSYNGSGSGFHDFEAAGSDSEEKPLDMPSAKVRFRGSSVDIQLLSCYSYPQISCTCHHHDEVLQSGLMSAGHVQGHSTLQVIIILGLLQLILFAPPLCRARVRQPAWFGTDQLQQQSRQPAAIADNYNRSPEQ